MYSTSELFIIILSTVFIFLAQFIRDTLSGFCGSQSGKTCFPEGYRHKFANLIHSRNNLIDRNL